MSDRPKGPLRGRKERDRPMGQTNVNTGGSGTGGFGAGMIIGILVLILVVLAVVFYVGPQIFINNTAPRSMHELLESASSLA
jgi:predicted metalloprotease